MTTTGRYASENTLHCTCITQSNSTTISISCRVSTHTPIHQVTISKQFKSSTSVSFSVYVKILYIHMFPSKINRGFCLIHDTIARSSSITFNYCRRTTRSCTCSKSQVCCYRTFTRAVSLTIQVITRTK